MCVYMVSERRVEKCPMYVGTESWATVVYNDYEHSSPFIEPTEFIVSRLIWDTGSNEPPA